MIDAHPAEDDCTDQSELVQTLPALTLPLFTPVPREKDRSNGWKPEVQRAFIEALAETGSVASACRRVGRSDHGAYLLRRHPEAAEFRRAWDAALDIGMRRLEDVAMDRALHGVEVPVYHFGAVVGARRVYNDRLLMFILRNRAPHRFSADSARPDAAARGQLDRLRKKWREEWDAERRAEDEKADADVYAEIDAELAKMRQRTLQYMSPATRKAYDTYLRCKQEDEENGYCPFDEELAVQPDD